MNKTKLWVSIFFAAIILLKVWSGFHGQTSVADSICEIAGFASLLIGGILLFAFTEMTKRRFMKIAAAQLIGELADQNYFAIFIQGILFCILGVLGIFLKWWLAATLGAPLMLLIILLFFRGWPNFRLDPKKVAQSVAKSRAEFNP